MYMAVGLYCVAFRQNIAVCNGQLGSRNPWPSKFTSLHIKELLIPNFFWVHRGPDRGSEFTLRHGRLRDSSQRDFSNWQLARLCTT